MAETLKIAVPADDLHLFSRGPQLSALQELAEVAVYHDLPSSLQEQIDRSSDAEIVVASSSSLYWPASTFEALPQLKMFASATIGTDSIDLLAATMNGAIVCNVPGKTSPVVAEHALALMLAISRKLSFYTAAIRNNEWPNVYGTYLAGKTLGVLGLGNSGTHLAKLAKGIGMNVVAWTFNPSTQKEQALGIKFVKFEELLTTSDVLSIHVRLSPQTKLIIGRQELGMMRPGSYLINVARAGIVDTLALVEVLNSGHLAGAGIDVFDREPLPKEHPLLSCENVILTPHRADNTPEGMAFLAEGVLENIRAYLNGHPQNVVIPV